MNYIFKVYNDGNQEYFTWEANTRYYTTKKIIKKDFDFSQSLLDFIDLGVDELYEIFIGMGNEVQKLYEDKDGDTIVLRKSFDLLAEKHIYFQLLRLHWFDKLEIFVKKEYGGNIQDFLFYKDLTHISVKIGAAQNQIKFIFNKALDITAGSDKTIQQRVASLYENNIRNAHKIFEFQPLTIDFERIDDSLIVEVLHPKSIIDIVDYFLREIIRREIGFKVCKSCGKYFAATAHGNTEFCNRIFQDTGKTCRDIGSLTKWREKVAESPAMMLYNKHYKTRFSRIRAGKITREVFQEWAAIARDYRDKVTNDEMLLDEFEDWLKSGRWV